MCTAVTFLDRDFYFGRTLDYERNFGEEVTLTPRQFPLSFRHLPTPERRYAMLGMAHVTEGFPLYYDGFNEKGLCCAGLNFVGYAHYESPQPDGKNLCHFEVIPWLLCQCATVREAVAILEGSRIVDTPFSDRLPAAKLHWLLADRQETVVLESREDGLRILPNPVGVLTNDPPFETQMLWLANHMQLSPGVPENRLAPETGLSPYCRGMGAIGLPGDLSSPSRFVRAAFTRSHAAPGGEESDRVGQFFHILGAVEQVKGCCQLSDGQQERTLYTCCCNASRGIYYYATYENRQITAIDLSLEDLDGSALVRYPLLTRQQIRVQNSR